MILVDVDSNMFDSPRKGMVRNGWLKYSGGNRQQFVLTPDLNNIVDDCKLLRLYGHSPSRRVNKYSHTQ